MQTTLHQQGVNISFAGASSAGSIGEDRGWLFPGLDGGAVSPAAHELGTVGHSFGGATALQFCHEDARCRAAIDLDGIPFGSVVTDGLAKPAMFLLSDHSREMSDPESHKVVAMIESIYARLPEPRVYATIRHANHFSFGDQILLNSQTAIWLLRLAGVGSLDGVRGLSISNDYVHTFFDVTLKDTAISTLKQLSARYPEVMPER